MPSRFLMTALFLSSLPFSSDVSGSPSISDIASRFAATLPLVGRESAISAPQPDAAPFAQNSPSIATNGQDFLIAWLDHRRGDNHPSVYAARVSRDGTLLDPSGILVATDVVYFGYFVTPGVIWAGDHYRIVLTRDGEENLAVSRITAEGILLDPEPRPVARGESATFVTSRDHILFLNSLPNTNGTNRTVASLRDFHGTVIRADIPLQSGALGYSRWLVAGASSEEGFLLVFQVVNECGFTNCHRVVAERVSRDGVSLGFIDLSFLPGEVGALSLAGSGEDYLLVRYREGDRRIVAQHLDASGRAVGNEILLPSTDVDVTGLNGSGSTPSVIWNGSEYVVVWSGRSASLDRTQIFATRVAPGSGEAGQPIQLSSAAGLDALPTISTNGREYAIAWQRAVDFRFGVGDPPPWDIFARVTASLDSPEGAEIRVSNATPSQEAIAATSNGEDFLIVRMERNETARTMKLFATRISSAGVPLDGDGLLVSEPSPAGYYFSTNDFRSYTAASDGKDYLIVWPDGDRLLTRRLSSGGVWLDEAPRQVETGNCYGGRNQLHWTGERYLLTWTRCSPGSFNGGVINVTTLNRDGSRNENRALTVGLLPATDVSSAWSGEELLIVWAEGYICCCITCPPNQLDIRMITVSRNGDVLTPPAYLSKVNGTQSSPTAAWGAGQYVVLWSSNTSIHGTRLSPEGVMLEGSADSDGVLLFTPDLWGDKTLIWNGSAFVLGFEERADASHSRSVVSEFTPGTTSLELWSKQATRTVVAQHRLRSYSLSLRRIVLASNQLTRTLAGYSRIPDEPTFGGVPRVFVRVLGRTSRVRPARP